jgi:hypothetical protein
MRLQPFLYRRFPQNGVGQHSSAVRAQDQAALVERIQIVSDGDGRGVEVGGEFINTSAAGAANNLENLRPPLFSHHSVQRRFSAQGSFRQPREAPFVRKGCRHAFILRAPPRHPL